MMYASNPTRYYSLPDVGQQPAWLGPLPTNVPATGKCENKAVTSKNLVADAVGLRLGPAASGAFSLGSKDGSLGRLVLPRAFTVDAQLRCYFVDPYAVCLMAFDPTKLPHCTNRPFQPVVRLAAPSTGAEHGHRDWSIAATSRLLLIVNPYAGALLGYRFDDWTLAETECFQGGAIDVAAAGDAVYCLTPRALYMRSSFGLPWSIIELPRRSGPFTRAVVDAHGEPHVLGANADGVFRLWKLSGDALGGFTWAELDAVDRTQFPFPSVFAVDDATDVRPRQFVIPSELASECDRHLLQPAEGLPCELAFPEVTKAMFEGSTLSAGFVVSELGGRRVQVDEYLPGRLRRFVRSPGLALADGQAEFWISPVIDSALYECCWDSVEVELSALPLGTSVAVWTYAFNPGKKEIDILECKNGLLELDATKLPPQGGWSLGLVMTPTMQAETAPTVSGDFLVRSRRGQFLRLCIQLMGDGDATPVVRRVTARAPRNSYADFLPAVIREDDASRDYLERFLAIFQAEWDRIDDAIDGMYRTFNPQQAPLALLDWLQSWIGVETPHQLPLAVRGRAVAALSRAGIEQPREVVGLDGTSKLSTGGVRRGTARHLREHLTTLLASLAGLEPADLQGFPWIIEGFRERACFTVGGSLAAEPGVAQELRREGVALAPPPAYTLWGSDATGRLQLGVNSVLGERKLMPTVRPELDFYGAFAHRFRVVAPACWASSPEAISSLRSAIEREKPAHVAYELELITPGVRIGFQSTVGIDTILGPWPPQLKLSEAAPAAGLGQGVIFPVAAAGRPLQVGDQLGTVEL